MQTERLIVPVYDAKDFLHRLDMGFPFVIYLKGYRAAGPDGFPKFLLTQNPTGSPEGYQLLLAPTETDTFVNLGSIFAPRTWIEENFGEALSGIADVLEGFSLSHPNLFTPGLSEAEEMIRDPLFLISVRCRPPRE